MSKQKDIDHFLKTDGLDSEREEMIGQHIGYRYDVNLVPDMNRVTPFLKKYMEVMGWQDLNWLEDDQAVGIHEHRCEWMIAMLNSLRGQLNRAQEVFHVIHSHPPVTSVFGCRSRSAVASIHASLKESS